MNLRKEDFFLFCPYIALKIITYELKISYGFALLLVLLFDFLFLFFTSLISFDFYYKY